MLTNALYFHSEGSLCLNFYVCFIDKSLIQKTPKSQTFWIMDKYLYMSYYFGSLLSISNKFENRDGTCFGDEFLCLFTLLKYVCVCCVSLGTHRIAVSVVHTV